MNAEDLSVNDLRGGKRGMCFFGKGMKKRRNGKNERKGKRGEREWGKVEMKKGKRSRIKPSLTAAKFK